MSSKAGRERPYPTGYPSVSQDCATGSPSAALDPFRGLATALSTSLLHATRVLDWFHVTRLGFAGVGDVRRRIQQQSTGHRRRRDDPLYRIRRVLLRRADRLSPHAWQRLLTALAIGDVEQQIELTRIAAQDLRLTYQAHHRLEAEQRLYRWLTHGADTSIPELHRLARTIDSWREELLAYFDTGGVSNGPTQATNLQIKKIKRQRIQKPRRLPTPAPSALRNPMAHSTTDTTQRTITTRSA
jgi:transposase